MTAREVESRLKVQSFPAVTPRPQPKRRVSGRARPKDPLAVWCEARTGVCTGRAVHRHHATRRSQGGGDADTIDVCAECHAHIHRNPAEAYERGWLRHGR